MDDINTLRRILTQTRVIAVVGLSADWHRPSYFAAKYMQEHGYRVIPVNPKYDRILGEKCYKSLRDIPEPVDMVDVFRKTQDVPPIADDAIAIGGVAEHQRAMRATDAACSAFIHGPCLYSYPVPVPTCPMMFPKCVSGGCVAQMR